MARSRASVACPIWQDPDWRKLDGDAQWLYLVLASAVTHREVDVAYWATFANVDEATVRAAFRSLSKAGAISVGAGRVVLNWDHLVTPSNLNRRRYLARWYRVWLMERGGQRCAFCGVTSDLTIDHIHPIVRDGGDEPENLQVLCRACNGRKGAR